MKYTPTTEFRGGSLLGYVEGYPKYSLLVDLFGQPTDADGYKVSTEWTIDFEDGLFARIYDWKASDLYEEGAYPVSKIRSDDPYVEIEWHIGGDDREVVDRVNALIEAAQEKEAA